MNKHREQLQRDTWGCRASTPTVGTTEESIEDSLPLALYASTKILGRKGASRNFIVRRLHILLRVVMGGCGGRDTESNL